MYPLSTYLILSNYSIIKDILITYQTIHDGGRPQVLDRHTDPEDAVVCRVPGKGRLVPAHGDVGNNGHCHFNLIHWQDLESGEREWLFQNKSSCARP